MPSNRSTLPFLRGVSPDRNAYLETLATPGLSIDAKCAYRLACAYPAGESIPLSEGIAALSMAPREYLAAVDELACAGLVQWEA